MKSQKGQYFSFDAIIASVIFILTLVSLVSYWYSVRSTLESQNNEIGKEALRISDQLFLAATTEDCAAKTGFALGTNNKKLNFQLLSDCAKTDLKTKFSTPFNIMVKINPKPSAPSCHEVTLGDDPPSSSEIKNLVKLRRIAALDCGGGDVLATIDISVYE
ncbi:hypothetical protein HYT84_02090 [Candidatus Micrarchaeota archaeon]|nr:hypothetical protein [Candidatus Micrarchaeota archaeon]